jgi:ABC-2 type transport system ATP-binding protein
MRIVLGVLSADAGEVTLDGRPLDAATRCRIGYMPEERGLYAKMKVGEQLEYLCRHSDGVPHTPRIGGSAGVARSTP